MTLGIMQPYFMPYIGYFSLIKHTDEFILFDTVQFIRHGWIERNRILKQTGGWQYIQVPLIKKDGRETLIKDVQINNRELWKQRILAQLQHYKKKAPYYRRVIEVLDTIFAAEYDDIVSLNKYSLFVISQYLGIERDFPVFSTMDIMIDKVNAPDEWALRICEQLGADTYINPEGGLQFFDRTKYERSNIEIYFQKMRITEYNQKNNCFEPGLSILDVMMYNSVEEINGMLDQYTLV